MSVDARDDRRRRRPTPRACCRARQARPARRPTRRRARARRRARRLRPDDRDLRERRRDVAELHVLGEDELIELRQHRVLHVAGHRQQHHVAELVDVQVRDHPSLRGEIRRVAALPRFQRDDVVGEQPLQVRRAVGARDDDPSAIGAIDRRRAMPRGLVGGEGSGRNHGAMLRHALGFILSARALAGAGRGRAARRVGPAAAGAAAAAGSRRDQLHDLPARRADRQRADRGHPHRRPAGRSPAPDASARRSTSSRAACRCATRRTGGRSSSRSTPPCADSRRRFAPASRARRRRATINIAGQATQKTDTIDAGALLLLPNSFFGPYEALAARLRTAAPGTEIPVYIVPQASFDDPRRRVVSANRFRPTARMIAARRTRVTLDAAGRASSTPISGPTRPAA